MLAARTRIWKMRFSESWANGGAHVYKWCKGEDDVRANMISRPDGSLTCNPESVAILRTRAYYGVQELLNQ